MSGHSKQNPQADLTVPREVLRRCSGQTIKRRGARSKPPAPALEKTCIAVAGRERVDGSSGWSWDSAEEHASAITSLPGPVEASRGLSSSLPIFCREIPVA